MNSADYHRQAFRIVYNFLVERSKAINQGSDTNFWTETTERMTQAAAQLNSAPLALDLLEACFRELERMGKQHT